MKLEKYNKKRDFSKTKEPKGKINSSKQSRFVIQYHKAQTKHYDFRLEYEGVLLSWAVPKGLSSNPKDKRLAVMVEDHPVDYMSFEGVIPKGNYGAGIVEIFDFGTYIPCNDFKSGLKKGHIKFVLSGSKYQGGWSLTKIDEKNWLIVKLDDQFTSTIDISLKNRQKKDKLPFHSCSVMLATLSDKVPRGDEWLFEIKYDGYRTLSFIENGNVKLISRNGRNFTKKFVTLAHSLSSFKQNCVLDGEIVAFNDKGISDFGLLQARIKNGGELFYVVFDLLALEKKDLRTQKLVERRNLLNIVLTNPPLGIVLSSGVIAQGDECFSLAKKIGFEGIVAKNINSPYRGARSEDWIKVKCYKRQEFVVIGYTLSGNNLSAILLGYYDGKELVYVGKAGTGFTNDERKVLSKNFQNLITSEKYIKVPGKGVKLIKPKLVAEIQFAEITRDGILRQASFKGLRFDKKPTEIKLEV